VAELVEAVLDRTGYQASLETSPDLQDATRVENLQEMVSVAREFDASAPDGTLADFLERVALVADATRSRRRGPRRHGDADDPAHGQGLEFPVVFSPAWRKRCSRTPGSLTDQRSSRRERRLAYVGITRAKERLYLTRARARNWWGRPSFHTPSRFLFEIPRR